MKSIKINKNGQLSLFLGALFFVFCLSSCSAQSDGITEIKKVDLDSVSNQISREYSANNYKIISSSYVTNDFLLYHKHFIDSLPQVLNDITKYYDLTENFAKSNKIDNISFLNLLNEIKEIISKKEYNLGKLRYRFFACMGVLNYKVEDGNYVGKDDFLKVAVPLSLKIMQEISDLNHSADKYIPTDYIESQPSPKTYVWVKLIVENKNIEMVYFIHKDPKSSASDGDGHLEKFFETTITK